MRRATLANGALKRVVRMNSGVNPRDIKKVIPQKRQQLLAANEALQNYKPPRVREGTARQRNKQARQLRKERSNRSGGGLFTPDRKTRREFSEGFSGTHTMKRNEAIGDGAYTDIASRKMMRPMGWGERGASIGKGTADYFWSRASGAQRAARIGAVGAGIIGTGVVADVADGSWRD